MTEQRRRMGRAPRPRANVHPLVRSLAMLMADERRDVVELADVAGYDPGTLKNWFNRTYQPSLVGFEDHLNAMGFQLVIRPRGTPRLPQSTTEKGQSK